MDIDQIRELLTDAGTYPHECDEIQMVETHISLVFLTGDFAYKVKKPVDFGFLDFSTLEKRRHYCELELSRNRVFAPDLYEKVMGLHVTEHGAELKDLLEGAQEYVVCMHQFPQSALLSLKVAAGDFSVEEAAELGRQLARLHAGLEQAETGDARGTPAAISYPVKENFSQISECLDDDSQKQRLDAIRSWSLDRLEAHHEDFVQRKKRGRIRACHGDLHLNNILWMDKRAVPFDCIEFNDEFRWIDVISELAFLLMDLEHGHQQELASHCLNGYLEVSGDFEGVELLRFYKVYRAMVRAKVAMLRMQQDHLDADELQALEKEYDSYVTLAEHDIRPEPVCLYITHGVSGSGKTTMARYVAGRLGAVHVRSDVERKRLFHLAPDASSDSLLNAGIYSAEASARTYHRLEEVAEAMISAGYPVIVDATFLSKNTRQRFFELGKRMQSPFAILDCAIDEQTARNRVQARMENGGDASEADLKVLEQQLGNQDFLSPQEQRYVVVIDMGKPLEDIDLEQLIRCECIAD
ncbi:MAG: AAA family ATPase [Ketobacteraceae bacterium]|nr:AAA family ATPase [Ketobacteraceae bacterium]